MASEIEAPLPNELENLIERIRAVATERLNAAGELKTETGSCRIDSSQVSFASITGGKVGNEDYVAFLKPASEGSIQWAASIADGVSGSVLGGVAAEIACKVALSALVAVHGGNTKRNGALPILLANRVLRRIGREIETCPDQFCPIGVPVSIWNRAVTSGKFLQTTLTVLWETEDQIQIVSVGDGGIVYSQNSSPKELAFHKFGEGALDCIGPKSAPRNIEAYRMDDLACFACFTDGLHEAVDEVEEFPASLFRQTQSAAIDALEFIDHQHPEMAEDNLSVVRWMRATS